MAAKRPREEKQCHHLRIRSELSFKIEFLTLPTYNVPVWFEIKATRKVWYDKAEAGEGGGGRGSLAWAFAGLRALVVLIIDLRLKSPQKASKSNAPFAGLDRSPALAVQSILFAPLYKKSLAVVENMVMMLVLAYSSPSSRAAVGEMDEREKDWHLRLPKVFNELQWQLYTGGLGLSYMDKITNRFSIDENW